jgi:isoleucyl-tRNA synthetase
MEYVLLEVTEAAEGSRLKPGERLVVAEALRESFLAEAKAARVEEVCRLPGAAIVGTVCAHPLKADGYEFPVPVYGADFVTTEQGTGFVHIAPGHGADDFELGQRHGLPTPETVADDGTFMPDVPRFAGKTVYTARGKPGNANPAVIAALEERGALIASGKLVHSYPHSWRSKAPLIFRATPQWFISMSHSDLRGKALAAIEATRWVPGSGRNRIYAMIEQRPDWCISRQRAWGVPITVFVDRRTREPLRDPAVNERIAEAFAAEGADCWFTSPPERFLGNAYRAEDFEQVMDIVDVWFESGSTHSFVLEQRADLEWPASLYLEGTDQHRGWFHSSLLESCGTRGRAPYDAVLTHGFTLDEQGRKMSKSLGNVVAPQEVVDKLGADILRLWVVASDYSEDVRVGPEVLKQQAEIYRRLRNTLRYILGALNGFAPAERLPVAEMEELERWVLHRLHELDRAMRQACNDFAFSSLFAELHAFCAVDLSAFYFDIRKDSLYCDRADSKRRRGCRTVLDELFQCLTAWLAPVLCFTAEEAWLARHPGDSESVHLRLFPSLPEAWRDEALGAKWRQIRDLRRVVTGALEIARADKTIGASLQAAPTVYATAEHLAALSGLDLAEIAITSGITLVEAVPPDGAFTLADVPGVGVVVALADGSKCQRCWRVLPEVGRHAEHPTLCGRCVDAVAAAPAAAE